MTVVVKAELAQSYMAHPHTAFLLIVIERNLCFGLSVPVKKKKIKKHYTVFAEVAPAAGK